MLQELKFEQIFNNRSDHHSKTVKAILSFKPLLWKQNKFTYKIILFLNLNLWLFIVVLTFIFVLTLI